MTSPHRSFTHGINGIRTEMEQARCIEPSPSCGGAGVKALSSGVLPPQAPVGDVDRGGSMPGGASTAAVHLPPSFPGARGQLLLQTLSSVSQLEQWLPRVVAAEGLQPYQQVWWGRQERPRAAAAEMPRASTTHPQGAWGLLPQRPLSDGQSRAARQQPPPPPAEATSAGMPQPSMARANSTESVREEMARLTVRLIVLSEEQHPQREQHVDAVLTLMRECLEQACGGFGAAEANSEEASQPGRQAAQWHRT